MAKNYLSEPSGKGSSTRLLSMMFGVFSIILTSYISYSYVEMMRSGIETASQIPIQLMPYVLIFVAGGVSMPTLKKMIESNLKKKTNE